VPATGILLLGGVGLLWGLSSLRRRSGTPFAAAGAA
jgi:hypothetical protein